MNELINAIERKSNGFVKAIENKNKSVSVWLIDNENRKKLKMICNISQKRDCYVVSESDKKTELAIKDDAYAYVLSCVESALSTYIPTHTFGCCHRYKECSENKKCIHPDEIYARGCQYRRNLEKNRIFY